MSDHGAEVGFEPRLHRVQINLPLADAEVILAVLREVMGSSFEQTTVAVSLRNAVELARRVEGWL